MGALSGSTLVPDLAQTIPAPTDNGLTYMFTMRKGVHYSDGTVVKASDFILGLHRALVADDDEPSHFWTVKGAESCTKQPSSCDLSDGIIADDAAGTVTFRLTEPDPELPYKLTLFLYPMPPGTPLDRVRTPIPGTGPYKIDGYTEPQPTSRGLKAHAFDLVRNTHFTQWSYAAQQTGFVDRVHYLRTDIATAERLVEQGKADLVQLTDPLPPGLLGTVHDRFRTRLYRQEQPETDWVVLNTRVPPFNNLKARQAFNYAVDRDKWVGRNRDEFPTSEATCQILPRNFPGYQPYCPYTVSPGSRKYRGPDLATARKLVEESGTKGMHVTVQGRPDRRGRSRKRS